MDDGRGEVQPPFHAAGEGGSAVVGPILQTDRRENLLDPAIEFAAADAVEFAEEAEVLAGRQVGINRQAPGARCRRVAQFAVGAAERLAHS